VIEVKGVLIEKIKRTPSVESFRFRAEQKIDFLPGQFLQVIFDHEDRKNKNLNKYLSFSSSPFRDYFEITKRVSTSDFSEKLICLNPGDEVLFKAPMGHVTFKDEYKKIGFLIGGIGITPVISIIEYIMDKGLDTDIELHYSNRNEEEIAFRAELEKWDSQNSKLKICFFTDCEPQDKKCIHGLIGKDHVCNGIHDYKNRIFFIYGPPGMVQAMKNICEETGCSKDMIKVENFIGY